MVFRGNLNRRDHLRFLEITDRTRRSYEKAVAAFFEYMRASRGRLPRTMLQLDDVLAESINHLFQEGDSVSFAGWVLSGLKRFLPKVPSAPPDLSTLLEELATRSPAMPHHALVLVGGQGFGCSGSTVNRFDLALLVLLGFAFFLRTMELVMLRFSPVRLFPDQGTVVIAIIKSKTSKGLQQSLSLHEPFLVQVLQFLWNRVSPSDLASPSRVSPSDRANPSEKISLLPPPGRSHLLLPTPRFGPHGRTRPLA